MNTTRAIFAGTWCTSLSYRIIIKKEDFALAAFASATAWDMKESNSLSVSCAPQDEGSDYHVHLYWRVREKDLSIEIEFVKGRVEPAKDEREPWAEQVPEWIEKFSAASECEAKVGADFVFPADRKPRFPLPMVAAIGPGGTEAEIDGISFSLSAKPEGTERVWLHLSEAGVAVHLVASKSLSLKTLDPRKEIAIYSAVMGSILEGRNE